MSEFFLCGNRLPVDIQYIGNSLEGKETDTDGKTNRRDRYARPEDCIDGLHKETRVFKYKQESQIHAECNCQKDLPGKLILEFLELQCHKPVEECAEYQQEDPERFSPGIEDQ